MIDGLKWNRLCFIMSLSNLQGPFFLRQTLAFVPLTLIIPLTLCEISFHGRTDDCNGCGLSARLVIGPNYGMNLGPHIISSMQGETFNGKNLFRSAFHNLPPKPAAINST